MTCFYGCARPSAGAVLDDGPVYRDVIPVQLGHYVYRLWAADGTCLYVGCAGERNPRRISDRLRHHRWEKSWWPEVARIDAAVLTSPAEVVAEEAAQVAALRPMHNKTLRGECSRGHDLTLADARDPWGGCARCRTEWRRERRAEYERKPDVAERRKARNRMEARRYRARRKETVT